MTAVAAGIRPDSACTGCSAAKSHPPAAWLLTAAFAILLTVGTLTALPAWIHARSPAAHALGDEPASRKSDVLPRRPTRPPIAGCSTRCWSGHNARRRVDVACRLIESLKCAAPRFSGDCPG